MTLQNWYIILTPVKGRLLLAEHLLLRSIRQPPLCVSQHLGYFHPYSGLCVFTKRINCLAIKLTYYSAFKFFFFSSLGSRVQIKAIASLTHEADLSFPPLFLSASSKGREVDTRTYWVWRLMKPCIKTILARGLTKLGFICSFPSSSLYRVSFQLISSSFLIFHQTFCWFILQCSWIV